METFFTTNSWVILLMPFTVFLVNGLVLGKRSWRAAAYFAVACMSVAFYFAVSIAVDFFSHSQGEGTAGYIKGWEVEWMRFASKDILGFDLVATIGMLLDHISIMMLVVVTAISVLVNIYSIGYMKDDPSAGRFFSLLSLFSFSMLGLVASTNIFQMFVFWELVGASSYLLIGFWYEKPSAVAASKKAFIVTRFADAFFLAGIIAVSYFTKTFDFIELNSLETAELLNTTAFLGFGTVNVLSIGTLLIFAGGWGKSAMFPLHIWLPDAMEGPTPVSSIIHSATMVVAGIYLTARLFPLFSYAPMTLEIISYVGAFTALFAAVIAITQSDIKRILAFSTLSQLGYMLFSLGISKMVGPEGAINELGYSASMFHVFTHAFFKCMLFLIAGQIIHVVHSNNIWDMGGLRKKMPFTYISCLIACLAIGGIFPFSGFWSKDEIILAALQGGHTTIFALGLFVGGLTAFYMFRLFFVTFHGTARKELHHVHEDPFMTFPIVVLAIPSAAIGYFAKDLFHHAFVPNMPLVEQSLAHPHWLPWVATASGVSGIVIAFVLYGRNTFTQAASLAKMAGPMRTVVENKFYIDEVYIFVTHKVVFRFIAAPIKWFDRKVVDGSMNLAGFLLHAGGAVVRFLQTGQVQMYLSVMIIGLLYFCYRVF